MPVTRQAGVLAVVLVATACASAAAQQVDQRALAERILRGGADQRSDALEQARALGPARTEPALRAALIEALAREARAHAQRYHADRRGEPLPPLADPEFIARVSRVVADLRDPRAIPALVGALGTGSVPVEGLLAFGEGAVPALLDAVGSAETSHYVVDDALLALRFMVEAGTSRPRSPGTLERIGSATKRVLTGKPYFTTLWRAIDLAVALRDPALRSIVQSLARDRSEVVARGIDDSDTIERTRRRAADRLAGIPALPRRP
jgi:hypothetical protein